MNYLMNYQRVQFVCTFLFSCAASISCVSFRALCASQCFKFVLFECAFLRDCSAVHGSIRLSAVFYLIYFCFFLLLFALLAASRSMPTSAIAVKINAKAYKQCDPRVFFRQLFFSFCCACFFFVALYLLTRLLQLLAFTMFSACFRCLCLRHKHVSFTVIRIK